MGLYRTNMNLYSSLKLLNRLLHTRRIADELGPYNFKERVFANIDEMYQKMDPLSTILKLVEKSIKEVERAGELG
jgi:hypothetical protein